MVKWYVRGFGVLVCSTLLTAPCFALVVKAGETASTASISAAFSNVPPAVPAAALATRPVAATPQTSLYKSYREWKTFMVDSATTRLQKTQKTIDVQRNDPNARSNSGMQAGLNQQMMALQNQLEKEELQVSMANELTISDYFVGYITQQKNVPDTIKDVASKLSPEEVAELMAAYADRFFKSTRTTTPNKGASGTNRGYEGE